MRPLSSLILLTLPSALAAQAPATVQVALSSFDFTPSAIHLRAGAPVVLHLVNAGSGGHNFSAPEFFAAAHDVSGPVDHGKVEVGGHRSVDIRLVPAAGHYRLRCTHMMHTAFGMSGEIAVD